MNIKSFSARVASAFLAALGAAGITSCEPESSNLTEHLDDEYVAVSTWRDDWSGDYIIAHESGQKLLPFSALTAGKGTAGKELKIYDGVVFGTEADDTKAELIKSGDFYMLVLSSVGYLGFDGKDGFVKSTTKSESDAFLWDVLYAEDGEGLIRLSPKSADLAICWNGESFSVTSGHKAAALYRRTVGTGVKNIPSTEPGGEEPDQPEPDQPGPSVPTNGKYGWFELPVVNYEQSGKYLVDKTDKSLYFAHHLCAGGEKGPNGKTARNFSACYSAEHHCPVWVAAPRHRMYTGSSGRSNAYKADPDIPSDIQIGRWSGYTRGHMVGSSDRTSSRATNEQVFYYSNIAPQVGGTFNTGGGAWNNMEDYFVDPQVCSDTLYTVIGCYFEKFTDKYGETVSPMKISGGSSYPTMYYYVLLRTKSGNSRKAVNQCSANELKCAAFVLRHTMEKGHKVQVKDMMTVAELEKMTGFSYFPNVPNAPKNVANASDWGL